MRVDYELTPESEPISIYVKWKNKSGQEFAEKMFIEVAPTEPAEFRVGVGVEFVFVTDGQAKTEYPAADYRLQQMAKAAEEKLPYSVLRLPSDNPKPGQVLAWVDAPKEDDCKNDPNYIGSGPL